MRVVVLLGLVALCPAPAQPASQYANGYAEGILAVDINADGFPDLILTPVSDPSLPDYSVQVFLNMGNGVLVPARWEGRPPAQKFVSSIVAGNFDGTGRPGLFLADKGFPDGSGAQSRLILPSAGGALRDATEGIPQQLARTMSAIAGDLESDGFDDLVVFTTAESGHLHAQIWRNDGSGTFHIDATALPHALSTHSFSCGALVPRPGQIAPDLLLFGGPESRSRVLLNDGTGHFSAGPLLPTLPDMHPAPGGCAAVADLNGDGALDVIVAYTGAVQILINNGDGTFRDETSARVAPLSAPATGVRRVALVTAGSTRALFFTRAGEPPLLRLDRGDGVFVETSAWSPKADTPWLAEIADFNRDGWLDFAFSPGADAPVEIQFAPRPLPPDGPAPGPQ